MRVTRPTQGPTAACLLATLFSLALAAASEATDSCSATGVMAGHSFSLKHCAAAVMPGENSVTIWFNEKEITAAEREKFSMSAYASSYHDGGERTMFLLAFCPGGGATTASPQAVTKLQLDMSHAKAPLAGATWLLRDGREFRVERLDGDAEPGGRLTGRITGERSSDGRPYRFDLTFDLQLPTQEAAAGIACGS